MSKEKISNFIEKVANKMMHLENETALLESCPISIIKMDTWEWSQGVGLYGLYRYYRGNGNGEIINFLIDWFDNNIKKGLPEKNVNTMCPMLTLSFVYEETGREDFGELCKVWAEWVMKEMPRTKCNGLQHIVTGHANNQQLWDDTLFMTVLFLARAGVLFDRKDYIDESIRQFLVHIKYLTDKPTGLWYHGWTFEENHNFAKALWARGNCWYTAGVVDYLDILPEMDGGLRLYLLDTLQSQVDALKRLQNTNGMWHTLLNENTSYAETSATAGFAYGILKAVRKGYLDKTYLEVGMKAAKAVMDRISEDGTVMEVSYGTGMGKELEDYRVIPICPMTYGQALTILMLTELGH